MKIQQRKHHRLNTLLSLFVLFSITLLELSHHIIIKIALPVYICKNPDYNKYVERN